MGSSIKCAQYFVIDHETNGFNILMISITIKITFSELRFNLKFSYHSTCLNSKCIQQVVDHSQTTSFISSMCYHAQKYYLYKEKSLINKRKNTLFIHQTTKYFVWDDQFMNFSIKTHTFEQFFFQFNLQKQNSYTIFTNAFTLKDGNQNETKSQ